MSENKKTLTTCKIETPLGPMHAIADERSLYLLEFKDCKGLEQEVARLQEKTGALIVTGRTHPIDTIEKELEAYFAGTLQTFKTPITLLGTPFQQAVWQSLQKIPFGKTISYTQLAQKIGNAKAFRAVARANGANQLALIIPCHRVINSNGLLGGYAGGVARKQWLVNHE